MKKSLCMIALLSMVALAGCGGGGGATGTSGSSGDDGGDSSRTLTWSAPSTRVDGSPVDASEIKGYRLLYGTASGIYTSTVDVGNETEYTFEDLTSGVTYYAVVVAYDGNMAASDYSDEMVFQY
ncbi:MAG: fibronectin type III domain-containing protein [Deltaproteobacteria bacterium]|nr:fibronectin type III domain-containing protein [Deltaproteobacteria bacterium]MCL4874168.1 fibronectin type III domain-containing protein [bacterium]